MGIFKSLKKDNKGASLIAVVIAMVFVVSIGVIIMNITLSNISMKEMELSSKTNFYSAEDVLETIKSSLTDNSAICLETAYVQILGRYADSIQSNSGVQSSFQAAYLDALISKYATTYNGKTTQWIDGSDPTFEKSKTHPNGEFAMGYYNKDVLTSSLTGTLKSNADLALDNMDAGKAQFEADYSVGTFTLKNIHIVFIDSRGYETSISTDLIMTTPELNFDGTNTIEEFMKYSIIADRQIYLTGSSNIKGNAYAGHDGIFAATGSGSSFTGSTVVTRGTVEVKNGATLTIGSVPTGSKATNLWAENVRTSGGETASTVNLIGNMYISDDLSLDGVNSKANLSGQYYGYNFQKFYTTDYVNDVLGHQPVPYERDADFSSSIIINGRNSKIDMTGLNQLLLSGHTYISKGNQADNSDIMMGESVSVRTNQVEYNVPDSFLIVSTNSVVSQNQVQSVRFRTVDERDDGVTGAVAFSKELFGGTGLNGAGTKAKIFDYVSEADPFNTYYYQDGTDRVPRFYLKFSSVQAANDFFAERAAVTAYSDAGEVGSSITYNLRKFLGNDDAIKISPDTVLTLSGSLLTVSPTRTDIIPTTLNSDLWLVPSVSTDSLGSHAQFADHTAQTYKSLQLDLTTTNRDAKSSDAIRFPDNGFIINDKTDKPLFYNLIDRDVLDNFLSRYTDRTYDNGASGATSDDAKVIVMDNSSEYTPSFKYGIIIATGDVNLNNGFTGMVMSGGKVTIAANDYFSDELMVSGLFEDDAALGVEATFTTIFPTYNNLASDVLGVVKVEDYIGYDNWTKYAE